MVEKEGDYMEMICPHPHTHTQQGHNHFSFLEMNKGKKQRFGELSKYTNETE